MPRASAPACRRRRSRATATLVALGVLVACRSDPSWPTGRLVDRPEAGSPARLGVGPTSKRALRGPVSEHVFSLDGAPPRPTLLYSAGVAGLKGTVRFEVGLRGGGAAPVVLQRIDVDAGAWIDGRVDLAGQELAGRELVLRRIPVAPDLLAQSGWGDPVLLPAVADDPAPSVVLISLDTLRADALGVYGKAEAETPALDAFAAAGVQYVEAYSPSVWTLPSHEALFTGRYPHGFGALDDGGRVVPLTSAPASRTPLASVLRAAGYLTAAFTGGGWVDAGIGLPSHGSFADGFDTYYGYRRPRLGPGPCQPERLDGESVFGGARAWLRERGSAPSFVFIHTYEPHDRCPFEAPRGVGRDRRFRWNDQKRPDGKRQVEALYEELVARTDRLVAGVLDELETLGLAERTLVVITSDHGELFGEHGDDGHGAGGVPYEELTRVPLLLRFPERLPAGRRIDGPASVTSVAGTILALLGLEPALPEPPLAGLGVGPETAGVVYVDAQNKLAVRDGRWKLIVARGQHRGTVLFDLEADPGETDDQSRRELDVRERLEGLAMQYWEASEVAAGGTDAPAASPAAVEPGAPGEPVAPVLQDQLRQLGYLE